MISSLFSYWQVLPQPLDAPDCIVYAATSACWKIDTYGFSCQQAKDSHEKWFHPLLKRPIVIAGKDSKDAKAYLERQVERSLEEIN